MRRAIFLTLWFLSSSSAVMAGETESVKLGRFGEVSVLKPSAHPSHVVLFVSGDGGWNLGVVEMAKALSTLDALVLGIDITLFLRALENSSEECAYPAADLELLSKSVQARLDFPSYVTPLMVGYSSGATLVYATLVQAPPTTFLGAVSLGFCPDLPLRKPFCTGHALRWKPGPKGKGYSFLPAEDLQSPWIAFQGTVDQVCDPLTTETFVKQVKGATMVPLPGVGHGFSVERNWMPQFKETFLRLTKGRETQPAPYRTNLKDLPLGEIPGHGQNTDVLAVVVSGDGGWAGIDREIAEFLSIQGISVVGLNSLKYFWKSRTADESAKDLERILRYYLSAWGKRDILLMGYSLGADVLPFMANRLS